MYPNHRRCGNRGRRRLGLGSGFTFAGELTDQVVKNRDKEDRDKASRQHSEDDEIIHQLSGKRALARNGEAKECERDQQNEAMRFHKWAIAGTGVGTTGAGVTGGVGTFLAAPVSFPTM